MTAPSFAPIFIVGCPRSGTTLLQQMLDAHPEVAITPETHFMRLFWKYRDEYGNLKEDTHYQRLLADLVARPEFAEMGLSTPAFLEAAWQIERRYAALFQLLLQQFAHQRNVAVVGEKTPSHVHYLADMQNFFPSARFVHIVRDPRAVVNSLQSVPWLKGSPSRIARFWRNHVRAARSCPKPVKARLFTLYYEQLVREPQRVLQALCDFLQLPFNPAMLTYYQRSENSVNVTREPWKVKAIQPLDQLSIERWRNDLSAAQVAEIEASAYFEMRYRGYQLENSTLPLLTAALAIEAERQLKGTVKNLLTRLDSTRHGLILLKNPGL
jgi:hypothetical protein